jgi:hypothetical protein
MTALLKSPAELALPQWMQDEIARLLHEFPARVPRKRGAEIVTRHVFETSHRTMERWPLPVRHLNGQAHFETRDLLVEAFTRLAAAPVLATGRPQSEAT